MTKIINFLTLIGLSSLFFSCGGPKSVTDAMKEKLIDSNQQMIEYSAVVLDFNDGDLFNIPPSAIVVETSPGRFSLQPIIIRNEKRTELIVNIDTVNFNLLTGVEIENNCPLVLARKQFCSISFFLNRDNSLAANQVLEEKDLILNLDGLDFLLPIQAQTNSGLDLDAIATEELEISRNSIDYGTISEGRSKAEIVIIKNSSSRLELPLNKDYSSLSFAEEVYSTCPVNNFLKRRSACFIMLQTKNDIISGNYNELLSIAGKDIVLNAIVDIAPIITSNYNVSYDKLSDYLFNDTNRKFIISIENETSINQTLYYDFFPLQTEHGIAGLDYPEAFSIKDQCYNNTILQLTNCYITLEYDPSRFHFGVVYEKEVSFNDEPMTLTFEGTSPCSDPSSSMYEPGTKLSQDKQTCVPNLGVFDSPDSVFGHAVFQ